MEKIIKENRRSKGENNTMTGETSPWFTYTDEHGAKISYHIPNLFHSVENLKKKIKDLEAKIAQNRQYTTDRTRGGVKYGGGRK